MRRKIQVVTDAPGAVTAGTKQGQSVSVGSAETISAAIVVSGTGVGTVQWQVSNDGTNWVNYGSSTNITGTPGNYFIEVINPSALNVRLSYGWTSGSFTPTATVVCKGSLQE